MQLIVARAALKRVVAISARHDSDVVMVVPAITAIVVATVPCVVAHIIVHAVVAAHVVIHAVVTIPCAVINWHVVVTAAGVVVIVVRDFITYEINQKEKSCAHSEAAQ